MHHQCIWLVLISYFACMFMCTWMLRRTESCLQGHRTLTVSCPFVSGDLDINDHHWHKSFCSFYSIWCIMTGSRNKGMRPQTFHVASTETVTKDVHMYCTHASLKCAHKILSITDCTWVQYAESNQRLCLHIEKDGGDEWLWSQRSDLLWKDIEERGR